MSLPVEPFLLELLRALSSADIELPLISGGLGIYLKHRWVVGEIEAGRRESLLQIPDVRATNDIDAILRIGLLLAPQRREFRRVLDELGYEPIKEFLQFKRPTGEPSRGVVLDLHAPPVDEPGIKHAWKSRPPRMGERGQKKEPPMLHAWPTPEAFAAFDKVQTLPLVGRTPDGESCAVDVHVPHPFASLCMKIVAADDHEKKPVKERPQRGERHSQDVYRLVAMLDVAEADDFEELRDQYAKHPEMQRVQRAVQLLFSTPDSPGAVICARNIRDAELERFTEALLDLFAPSGIT